MLVNSGYWLLAAVNAAAAALLVNAGVAKTVAPRPLLQAMTDLTRQPNTGAGESLVRALGVAEIVIAVALLIGWDRLPAAIAASVLGVCFAAAGLLGLRRGSSVPCGCFGGASRQPLGWANVGFGVALAAVWPVSALSWVLSPHAYTTAAVLLAAAAAAALCLWLNRQPIMALFPAARLAATRNEVS